MEMPEWLSFTLRVFVILAMIPAALQAYRQARGALSRKGLIVVSALSLFWLGALVFLIIALVDWEITNPVAISIPIVVLIVACTVSMVAAVKYSRPS